MTDLITVEFNRRALLLEKFKNRKSLEAAASHYSNNPVDFINDWAVTQDPRVKPVFRPFVMWEKQVEFINWLYAKWSNRESGLCEKSRDAGATWLCCAFAWWLWIFHTDQVISFGSRKEGLVDKADNPNCIFDKIRTLIQYTPDCFMPEDYSRNKHDKVLLITNPSNGTTIVGEGGDNIGRGGRSSIIFKDESAFYERPEAIEAALSQNSDVRIDVSTPNGIGNPFYRKRHGGVIDVFTFKWTDDPRKDQKWYDRQKRELDSVILAQEVDLSYDASVENAFINSIDVKRAMETPSHKFELFNVPFVLGVDCARFGKDKSALTLRQGRVVHWAQSYPDLNTMQLVGLVGNVLREVNITAVCVDLIGIGAGVFDRLHELYGSKIVAVTVSESSGYTSCSDKRSEIWYLMREWLKEPCSLPNKDSLMVDLCGLQYSFNSNSEYVLESKKLAKKRGIKSPDEGDSLALTFSLPDHLLDNYHEDDYYEEEDSNGRNSVTGY